MDLSSRECLEKNALRIRYGIMKSVIANKGGHIGGAMDLAELMSVLYTDFMRVNINNPLEENRDYLILSKGHSGTVLYSALALKGFFPYERLEHLNKSDSLLPGHCDRLKVPGVDATTGSLGQGLSIACGVALAAKLKKKDQRIFCIIGDGEAAEGQIWEAAQFAAHYKLDNLILFLDWNKKQLDGYVKDIMDIQNPMIKFEAFGWNSIVVPGGNVTEIQKAIVDGINNKSEKPNLIVLDSVKGQNIKCVMDLPNNHCFGLSEALKNQMLEELKNKAKELNMEEELI